ncbi:MAG: AEC family transporter [Alphaproteobacteria bacterium]
MIGALLGIVAPVFAIAGIGYGWAKSGRDFDTETVSHLVTNIGLPCMVFSTLSTLPVELSALGQIALAAGLSIAAYLVIGSIILRLAGLPIGHYLPSLSFANAGNMGLPICLFAFGAEGLALGTGFFMVGAVANTSLGPFINSGKFSFAEVARTPVIYVIAPALVVRFGGYGVPEWIANTAALVGGIAIPLMLLMLGVSLSRVGWRGVRLGGALAVLRITMGLGVGWCVAALLGLSDTARGVLLLQTAMPAAVLNYIFALRYETDPETVAGIVMQSTLLSILVLPILLAVILP